MKLTKSEQVTVNEIAWQVLGDTTLLEFMADRLDMSDKSMLQLRDKLKQVMGE